MELKPPCWPLEDLRNQMIVVELSGGRIIEGILRSSDHVGNLVIADATEVQAVFIQLPNYKPRKLGAIVVRAPHIVAVNMKS